MLMIKNSKGNERVCVDRYNNLYFKTVVCEELYTFIYTIVLVFKKKITKCNCVRFHCKYDICLLIAHDSNSIATVRKLGSHCWIVLPRRYLLTKQ